jgi:hypothetical protein
MDIPLVRTLGADCPFFSMRLLQMEVILQVVPNTLTYHYSVTAGC